MRNLKQIKKKLKTLEPLLKERFKVKRIGIFGSFVKGQQRKKSDIDILVEFRETIGMFEFIDLAEFLEKSLNLKVDLVTKNALKPLLKAPILKEERESKKSNQFWKGLMCWGFNSLVPFYY